MKASISGKTYEAHITMKMPDQRREREYIDLARQYNWHCSKIAHDPILGPGTKFYFTISGLDNERDTFMALSEFAEQVRLRWGKDILREKIERVIHDTVYQ